MFHACFLQCSHHGFSAAHDEQLRLRTQSAGHAGRPPAPALDAQAPPAASRRMRMHSMHCYIRKTHEYDTSGRFMHA